MTRTFRAFAQQVQQDLSVNLMSWHRDASHSWSFIHTAKKKKLYHTLAVGYLWFLVQCFEGKKSRPRWPSQRHVRKKMFISVSSFTAVWVCVPKTHVRLQLNLETEKVHQAFLIPQRESDIAAFQVWRNWAVVQLGLACNSYMSIKYDMIIWLLTIIILFNIIIITFGNGLGYYYYCYYY